MPDNIYNLTRMELRDRVTNWGEPGYRADQIWTALYHDLAPDAAAMTTLPKKLRERLSAEFEFGGLTPANELQSSDGQTRKILFRLPDARAIESVLMGYAKRRTTCISSQAGCAMGCVFCATGQMGFQRHLQAGEIVAQVMWFARELRSRDDRLTNIVVMGMGEPLHNYEATLAACDILNDAEGFNFGARRITISTVGLVPAIRRFADERRQVNLAISLHAATDELRATLLPVNRRYPLNEVFEAARYYAATTHRRITFEWALIAGVNDTPEQAETLAKRVSGLLCHVNVIPLNPTAGYDGHASTRERVARFSAALEAQGVPCTVRVRRGIDVAAGCGQLAVSSATPTSA